MFIDTLIIGAGIYGISTADCLYKKKAPFMIVGDPFDMWRTHTFDSMMLRSDFPMSEIYHPLARYSCENFFVEYPEFSRFKHSHVPVAIYRKYLDWVETHIEYPLVYDKVLHLNLNTEKTFRASLISGKIINSRNVVIATGVSDHKNIPPEFISSGRNIIHSFDVQQIQNIKNSRVLVAGSGQSAAESIEVLLKNTNNVEWFGRHRPVYFEQPVNISPRIFTFIIKSMKWIHLIPLSLRKILNKYLSAPTVMPDYEKIFNRVIRHIELPKLGDYDVIIAATGFSGSLKNIAFISEEIKNRIFTVDKIPEVNKNFQSNLQGLYFSGSITNLFFGPAVKFIIGSHYTSRLIAEAIAR